MARSHPPRQTIQWFSTLWTRHLGRTLLPLLLVITLLTGALARPTHAASSDTKILPQLQDEAAQQPDGYFRVVVQRVNKDLKADEKLKSLGGVKIKDLKAEGFVANIKGSKLDDLGKDSAVKYVSPDAKMRKTGTIDQSLLSTLYPSAANAAGLWTSATTPGVTGAGVGIAVIDTGVNAGHLDFKNGSSTRIAAKVLFNSQLEKTNDGHGHGTHIAGTITGNSWTNTSTAARGKYIGVAPESKIINVRVADETGMSYLSDVVNAIDWVIANRQTYNIRVINLSLVSSVAESAKTSVLAAAVEKAWFNGILVVVAAGNNGPDTLQYPPANDPFVITVGASDPMGTALAADDTIAPWSSYGTTQDGFSKPDVAAPGRYIIAPLASSTSTLGTQYKDRIVDGSYIRLSGTSMAAPVVAGVAALAFEKHPEWTNDQVKWLLMNTATQLGGLSPLPGQGAGAIDAAKVVHYVGTPQFANQGLAVNEQLIGPDGKITYDSQASWSTASWSTASWSTASWSTASWSTASWSTASWSTSNWSTASWSSAVEKGVE